MAKSTLKTSVWTGVAAIAVGASLLTLPASAPAGSGIGEFPGQRCYPAKRVKGFDIPPQVATVIDTLQVTNSTIGKPFMVCVPASILGGSPINATVVSPVVNVCYKVKDDKGTPKFPPGGTKLVFNGTVPLLGFDLLELKASKVVCLSHQEEQM